MEPSIREYFTTVVRIKNDWADYGTGFLLSRGDGDAERIFVVTNKHVLGTTATLRADADKVSFFCQVSMTEGWVQKVTLIMDLNPPNGEKGFREHPDPDVDVLVIDITSLQQAKKLKLLTNRTDVGMLATPELIRQFDIGVGDDIVVIGYPDLVPEIEHERVHLPLMKGGIIASFIGERISVRKGEHVIPRRGFVVDGITVPGLSGSPVILKPNMRRNTDREALAHWSLQFYSPPALILGIVSDTTFAPVRQESEPARFDLVPVAFVIRE